MNSFEPKELRAAFGSFVTGVTVVTAKAKDGSHVGFTANSFTSVSLNPPLLLVCPGNHLSSINVFRETDHFAINILAENQENISNLFASSKGDRFGETDWSEDNFGSPVIEGVSAHFSCKTRECIDAGDHIILIGEVKEFGNGTAGGLGYSSSGYFSLNPKSQMLISKVDYSRAFAGAVVECDGHVLVQEIDGVLQLPTVELKDPYHAPLEIQKHLKKLGQDIDLGQTYSVFDDTKAKEHFTFFRATAKSLNDNKAGKFVRIDQLDAHSMNQPAIATMMERFKSEYDAKLYGLFVGNTVSGDVHIALDS